MKSINIFYLFALVLFTISCEKEDDDPFPEIEGTKYEVTFTFNWSSTNFPTDYPSNAHFSKLIGWSHDTNSTFFQVGTMASNGIEVMAETGGTDALVDELMLKIENNEGLDAVVGSGLSTGTGTITVDLALDKDNTAITLATMIAPSPDWYVAIVNINLLENGQFVDSKTIEAHVYDAGTDSGLNYTSPDEDTDPQEPIHLFVDAPLGDGSTINPALASVTFKKVE